MAKQNLDVVDQKWVDTLNSYSDEELSLIVDTTCFIGRHIKQHNSTAATIKAFDKRYPDLTLEQAKFLFVAATKDGIMRGWIDVEAISGDVGE